MNLASERLESVKAGTIAALAASGLDALITLATSIDRLAVIHVVITGFSGFLFGVTYRYVVRADRNVHLGQGAILAFGLVRGLAALEPRLGGLVETIGMVLDGGSPIALAQPIREAAWLLLRSLLPFAGAATSLGLGLQRDWLKPFSSST